MDLINPNSAVQADTLALPWVVEGLIEEGVVNEQEVVSDDIEIRKPLNNPPLTQGGEGEGGGEQVGGAARQQGQSCASRSLQVKFLLLQETQYKAVGRRLSKD